MRVLVQRVSRAEVRVAGNVIARVGRGMLALVGFTHSDGEGQLHWMADKIASLRIFPDDAGKMNRALGDIPDSGILVVSQFTLYGDAIKGRRPSFVDAAPAELSNPLYQSFIQLIRARGLSTAHGEFGADMEVELVNDGPVTIWLER